MRLDGMGASAQAGPLGRIDPRWKLIAALVFVATVIATPVGLWWAMAIEASILAAFVAASRLPVGGLIARWVGFAIPLAFLAAMVAIGHPARTRLGFATVAGSIVARNGMAFGAVLLLSGTTPFPRLLDGLRRLGAPRVLVATLHFMFRYMHVLGDELVRMVRARRSRSFRRLGPDWGLLTGLIGVLFVRAMERGERVHAAMMARGWDGTIRTLDGADAP